MTLSCSDRITAAGPWQGHRWHCRAAADADVAAPLRCAQRAARAVLASRVIVSDAIPPAALSQLSHHSAAVATCKQAGYRVGSAGECSRARGCCNRTDEPRLIDCKRLGVLRRAAGCAAGLAPSTTNIQANCLPPQPPCRSSTSTRAATCHGTCDGARQHVHRGCSRHPRSRSTRAGPAARGRAALRRAPPAAAAVRGHGQRRHAGQRHCPARAQV